MAKYLGIIGILSVTLILLGYLAAPKTYNDTEKLSPYECGFSIYNSAKAAMNIRYYIICLLYLLFDLELSYLLPLLFVDINFIDITRLSLFILILILGLILEFNTCIVISCSSCSSSSYSSSSFYSQQNINYKSQQNINYNYKSQKENKGISEPK